MHLLRYGEKPTAVLVVTAPEAKASPPCILVSPTVWDTIAVDVKAVGAVHSVSEARQNSSMKGALVFSTAVNGFGKAVISRPRLGLELCFTTGDSSVEFLVIWKSLLAIAASPFRSASIANFHKNLRVSDDIDSLLMLVELSVDLCVNLPMTTSSSSDDGMSRMPSRQLVFTSSVSGTGTCSVWSRSPVLPPST
ncbi:hypothetical protein MJO29_001561 [Puccinia striiformis f. sp. tritici]|nr:hypothetical protein MJO29_001561 [Puccinia striiformis f. sp. tritici]